VKANSISRFKKSLDKFMDIIDKWILKGLAKHTLSDISNPVMVDDGRLERKWTAESDVTYYSP